MRFYEQRHTQAPGRTDGHDANGVPGDCFRCCVATLVDLPYEQVPHFVQHSTGSWVDYLRRWLREVSSGEWDICQIDDVEFPVYVDEHDRPVILSGPSPRGPFKHCVIGSSKTGEVWHDPHPSGAGLGGPPTSIMALVSPYLPDPAPPRMLTP